MIELRGQKLTLEQVAAVAHNQEQVALADDARSRMEQSRRVVEKIVAENRTVYGVNTGFGKLSDVRIETGELRRLQLNLVRSHSCGLGDPLSIPEARAMLLLRANVLACGLSGARPLAAETLVAMLERGVTPVIPEKGSVGASGDLAPLAHLALCAIGEGEAFYKGERLPAADALKQAEIGPLQLEVKEGLALLNGTQAMGAVGGLALQRADRLVRLADLAGAMSLEALKGTPVAFDARVHAARPHAGQSEVASHLRRLLEGSEIRASHLQNDPRIQDAYSLRCMPQVHGAVRDTLTHCREVMEIEVNSAVDNPLVFLKTVPTHLGADAVVRPAERSTASLEADVISGGNFHGQPLAFALDFLGIALGVLAGISERRLERLVNPALSEGLPPFLAAGAGLNSGFMMAQVAAASLVSENKVLAHPASVDSITTSGNKEDYVSMGMTAALKLKRIVENSRHAMAIEAMAAAQALDFLVPLKTSKRGQAAHAAIRSVCATMDKDRVMYQDFAKVADLIASGMVAAALR